MILLRKECYPNDFSDKAGTHMVIARRIGGRAHSLKFIRYGTAYTRLRLYSITEEEYHRLVTLYGKLIQHSRIISEYILADHRQHYDIWIARQRHTRTNNVFVVYPNNTTIQVAITPNKLADHALGWNGWRPEIDNYGNQWLYTTFKVNRRVIHERYS